MLRVHDFLIRTSPSDLQHSHTRTHKLKSCRPARSSVSGSGRCWGFTCGSCKAGYVQTLPPRLLTAAKDMVPQPSFSSRMSVESRPRSNRSYSQADIRFKVISPGAQPTKYELSYKEPLCFGEYLPHPETYWLLVRLFCKQGSD